jgi:hypothetical protein
MHSPVSPWLRKSLEHQKFIHTHSRLRFVIISSAIAPLAESLFAPHSHQTPALWSTRVSLSNINKYKYHSNKTLFEPERGAHTKAHHRDLHTCFCVTLDHTCPSFNPIDWSIKHAPSASWVYEKIFRRSKAVLNVKFKAHPKMYSFLQNTKLTEDLGIWRSIAGVFQLLCIFLLF